MRLQFSTDGLDMPVTILRESDIGIGNPDTLVHVVLPRMIDISIYMPTYDLASGRGSSCSLRIVDK